jgi:outer membrane lipoprotein LolB
MSDAVISERRHVRRFAVGCVLICMTALLGCGTTLPSAKASAEPADWFDLEGRISVRVEDRRDAGQLRWSRTADEERIGLFTPFGTQVAELSRGPDGQVTLRKGDEVARAESMAALSREILGVPLDIDRLARWAQGSGLKTDEATRITLSDGSVWEVTVEGLHAVGKHTIASRLTATKGDTVVKLIIDQWRAR